MIWLHVIDNQTIVIHGTPLVLLMVGNVKVQQSQNGLATEYTSQASILASIFEAAPVKDRSFLTIRFGHKVFKPTNNEKFKNHSSITFYPWFRRVYVHKNEHSGAFYAGSHIDSPHFHFTIYSHSTQGQRYTLDPCGVPVELQYRPLGFV